jgi:hypothetical protein
MKTITLHCNTTVGSEQIIFDLCDNEIAQQWYKKLEYLKSQNIDIDKNFTSDTFGLLKPYQHYKEKLDVIINWINLNTPYTIEKKVSYNQEDLCSMHDIYVLLANDPTYDVFNETYLLNKLIHMCELTIEKLTKPSHFTIAWGMNDGITMEEFKQDPYQHYTQDIIPGQLYLAWAEIGKKPSGYWHDGDPENLDNFLNTTRPHRTWSSHCKIILANQGKKSQKFWQWFEAYKTPFLEKWNLQDWGDLEECGAIELAIPRNPLYYQQLEQTFILLESIEIN